VGVIRISILCEVDTWQWRSGEKNIILMVQFHLLIKIMVQFLRREIMQLPREMK